MSLPPTSIASAGQFGVDRNRLTGEVVSDPSKLQRRPIAVKISNAPAKYTRPQSGLGQADLVYEHVTEGSITRFTAIIYGQTPPRVGPIRSARLLDLELPAMYDAALAYSGSSIGVSRKLFNSDFRERILRTNVAGYYRTGENKPYEHTLYAQPEQLWEVLDSRSLNQAPQFNSVMAFGEAAPQGGRPANSLAIRYRKFTAIEWRYDPVSGRYRRWADGVEHLDANSGDQISAANVVVLLAPHRLDQTICEHQSGGRCLAHSTEIQLWGTGQALLLRGGQAYDVTWNRQQRHDLLTLLDGAGRPFPLQIGNTWLQVMPLDYLDSFSVEPMQ
ncbi:MAG: DUF3048 domain-containing protein [Chloroflexota bacterium]|nr:MAG: DUF3048 domain-containing protein [Chloroflexota bacterium]